MDTLKQLTIWLASGVEGAAAVLIGLAAVEATWPCRNLHVKSADLKSVWIQGDRLCALLQHTDRTG